MSERHQLKLDTSSTSTRYEIEIKLGDTWYMWHQRKDLDGVRRAVDKLNRTRPQDPTRVVIVSETRRIIPETKPSHCLTCETVGIDHPGLCDRKGSLSTRLRARPKGIHNADLLRN